MRIAESPIATGGGFSPAGSCWSPGPFAAELRNLNALWLSHSDRSLPATLLACAFVFSAACWTTRLLAGLC